ncbi:MULTISPECIES: ABC transporter substrate-binding protein [unclassified Clostridium]|uniref:ABC transporter substrate-binding protein n=1 Tax=unclassified Clostridium TaxID=2614128 RepID=UPI001EEEE6A1|nr:MULTISPECIES: ABC transporter substrate-binding protein [unclassified Clostridium]
MRRKKIFTIISTVVLSLSVALTGCSKGNSNSAKQVQVDIFQFKVEIHDELQNAVNDYMKDHPDVKINLSTVGGGDDYGAALKAKFQSGQEPAIYNVGGPQDIKDWIGKLEDLSGEDWVKNAVSGTLNGVTVDGKVYAAPMSVEGYGLIYNKEIFKAAGIDSSKINSYKTLEEAVKILDEKIKSGALKSQFPNLEAVFELPASETWVTGLHTSNAALSQEFTSDLAAFESKTVEFKYGEGFKKLIDLQATYSSNGTSKGKLNAVKYSNQVEEGLAVERVAIVQQGNWIYNAVNGVDPKVAENLDILPMSIEGGKEDTIPVGVPMYWAVNSGADDKVKEAAKDFLEWLYTSDKGKDYVVNKFFFIPAYKGFENVKPQDSLGKAVAKYSEEGKTTPWVFMGYPTAWGMDTVGTNIQKYLDGQSTWEDAIKDSQAKWQESRK